MKKASIAFCFLALNAWGANRSLTYIFDSLSHPEPQYQKRLQCEVFQDKVVVETTVEGVTLRKVSPVEIDEASWNRFQALIEEIIFIPLVSVPGPEQKFTTRIFVFDPVSEELDTLRQTGNQFVASRRTEAFARLGKILIYACRMAGFPGSMNETFASSLTP